MAAALITNRHEYLTLRHGSTHLLVCGHGLVHAQGTEEAMEAELAQEPDEMIDRIGYAVVPATAEWVRPRAGRPGDWMVKAPNGKMVRVA